MIWEISNRADPRAAALADRHYSRQSIGAKQFVPPGRCVVLYSPDPAYWVTSWPFAEYVKHAWAGAWMCSAFRKEGPMLATDGIRDALAATRFIFGDAPPLGLVTFIDRAQVRPTRVRGVDVYGWTWLKAGFRHVGETKKGLLAFQIDPGDMPEAAPPTCPQLVLL